jgi:5'-nucleotidase
MRSVLVCNDDGVQSFFLRVLVEALQERFERVLVAAPLQEQSWRGRAVSRHGDIRVERLPASVGLGPEAWAVDGTPTDCANIGLGHLFGTGRPDAFVSGINLGFNTTANLIFCSGTVAAALEGALWGIPALAFSKEIKKSQFARLQALSGKLEGPPAQELRVDARRAAAWAFEAVGAGADSNDTQTGSTVPNLPAEVININFPADSAADTPVVDALPARLKASSLFTPVEDGQYRFQWGEITRADEPDGTPTDLEVLAKGMVSRSILDFTAVRGRSGQVPG